MAVPAHIVKSVLEDCVAKKVKIVVIATSAFKEIGRGELQNRLTQYCRDNQLSLIGPNLVGLGNKADVDFCEFVAYAGQEAIMKLRDHGIPAYPTAEQAVNAMVALHKYGQIKKNRG